MKKWYKKCPFCANEIKEKAIKCQFCWEFLNIDAKITGNNKPDNNKPDNNKPDNNKPERKIFDESRIKKTDEKYLTLEEKALKKAMKRVNTAFWFQCLCFIGSLITFSSTWLNSLLFWESGDSIHIIDLIYSWTLTFFIFKKNRMATLFSFLYYVLSSMYLFITNPIFQKSFMIRFLIAGGLFMWIIWSFKYHALTNQKKLSISEIVLLIIWAILTSLFVLWFVASF